MEPHELQERIAEFPRWHYRFDFGDGVTTPVLDRGRVNRHEQRRRYFFDALLQVTGGSLRGRRVLDLGCNAGLWSLNAIEAGADFVLGVDIRQTHIDQASLVFAAKGVDESRYRFERGDVFEHDFGEPFDVVLCLGLLEHVAKPVELFERMAAADAEILVLDTGLSRASSSCFEVSSLDEPDDHGALVLVPTRAAVIELADRFGFHAVPLARNMTDYTGMDDYRALRRLAFLCSRSVSLAMLPRETASPLAARWATMIDSVRRG
ncbi:MAG: class I SAM-dependent methyltransferase [Solirubrobacteraceae bacterium]